VNWVDKGTMNHIIHLIKLNSGIFVNNAGVFLILVVCIQANIIPVIITIRGNVFIIIGKIDVNIINCGDSHVIVAPIIIALEVNRATAFIIGAGSFRYLIVKFNFGPIIATTVARVE
jgi:hypothetical protein